ncbi:MAG TPA: hypothetical protein VNY05_06485 [Candidatus Acidoferrales bacterium]|jgi:hypothetical protein|nr:hypothetical protein [Candidatus Acidoferrales bacterium]
MMQSGPYLWGRLFICGGLLIRLRDAAASVARVGGTTREGRKGGFANPPQVRQNS